MTDPKPGDGLAGTEEQLPFRNDPAAPESVEMSGTGVMERSAPCRLCVGYPRRWRVEPT